MHAECSSAPVLVLLSGLQLSCGCAGGGEEVGMSGAGGSSTMIPIVLALYIGQAARDTVCHVQAVQYIERVPR